MTSVLQSDERLEAETTSMHPIVSAAIGTLHTCMQADTGKACPMFPKSELKN